MVSMLKTAYHPNDSCVIAHNNVVQEIRKGGTDSKGLHFAAEEDDGQCEGEGGSEEDGRSCACWPNVFSM